MKKNYVVIRQMFYKNYDGRNIIDISMPIDASDINSFSSKKRALNFITRVTDHSEIPFVECKQEVFYSRTKATAFAQQSYGEKSGVRIAYLLVENYIND